MRASEAVGTVVQRLRHAGAPTEVRVATLRASFGRTKAIAQVNKVRIGGDPVSMEPDELLALVRMQVSHVEKASRELNEALTERAALIHKIEAMEASRSWRYTRPLRGWRRRR